MISRPLPFTARHIVRLIQKQVPRPALETVRLEPVTGRLRIYDPNRKNPCCPMGLMPDATVEAPTHIRCVFRLDDLRYESAFRAGRTWRHKDYPTLDQMSVISFAGWWDDQRDPEAAIAAVWDLPEDDEVVDPRLEEG